MKAISVLSLCDGIAGAYQALKVLRILVKKYYAVELASEVHARATAEYNHPDIIRPCDDVREFTQRTADNIGKIDLLIAGFPCQTFSRTGKGSGFAEKRGQLIYELMRIKEMVKPRYWLFENVVPNKEHAAKLCSIIGCNYVKVNSKAYGAQSRTRAFWSSHKFLPLTGESSHKIHDVLLPREHPEVVAAKRYPFYPLSEPYGKSVVIVGTITPRNNLTICTMQERTKKAVISTNGKSPARLAGDSKKAHTIFYPSKISPPHRIYDVGNKHPCCMATAGGGNGQRLIQHSEGCARRLTVTESMRLQNLPDTYFPATVPKTAALKALGNGYDIRVVSHILWQMLYNTGNENKI